jgi:GrpB-like predicted nucleotidyltransferase (UPF0157 family)
MSRKIEVVPHRPEWAHKYALEATLLHAIFGDLILSIHHIGSTAIPGILAKPVIDIMIVAADLDGVDALNPAMISAGYEPMGEFGIHNRRYFKKNTDGVRSHHVHAYLKGTPNILEQLNFRDYLRTHPDEAQAYSQLKEKLAEQYRYDSENYTESKTDFVQRVNRLAAAWRKANPAPIESD